MDGKGNSRMDVVKVEKAQRTLWIMYEMACGVPVQRARSSGLPSVLAYSCRHSCSFVNTLFCLYTSVLDIRSSYPPINMLNTT
jgi:hypothetical protein